jgi:polysaccharide transporter, PST family
LLRLAAGAQFPERTGFAGPGHISKMNSTNVLLLPRRLRENIAALSFLQCMNYIAPLITVPYLVRVLGPAHYGLVSFSQALILYFDTFTDFGFNLSATRGIASHSRDAEALSRAFWTTVAAKAVLMFLGGAILAAIVITVPSLRSTCLVFAASFLNTVGIAFLPVWFFQGLRQMRVLTTAQAISRLATIPAIFLFVHGPEDYVRTAAIQGAVPILSVLILIPWIWPRIARRLYLPTRDDLHESWRSAWPLFASNSSMLLSTSSTTVILGFAVGNIQVGYFSAADKLVKALTALMTPVSQALYPHIVSMRAESPERALQFIRKSFFYVAGVGLVATGAAFFLAGPVGRLMFGSSFGPSIVVLRCLSPMPFLAGVINLLGTQTMIAFDMDRAVIRIVLRCLLITLPLIALLSYLAQAPGAAVASSLGALLIAVSMAVTLRKHGLAIWTAELPAATRVA